MKRFWGIRAGASKRQVTRISNEKYENPRAAAIECFGVCGRGFEYKDFGTKIADLRIDSKRIALIENEEGWTKFDET